MTGGEVEMPGWICLLAAASLAQDDEIVVIGEARLAEAFDALHEELERRNYRRVLRLGSRSWYLSPKLWRPGVMVHEEGFARVRGHAVLPLGVRWTVQPLKVEGTFLVQSRRKRSMQKAELVTGLEPHLRAIRDARWAIARGERADALRDELATLWFDGVDRAGRRLPDRPAIREAIVQRWLATSSGEAGAGMRAIIDTFVQDVVQDSDAPFDAAELARVRARVPPGLEPPPWSTDRSAPP